MSAATVRTRDEAVTALAAMGYTFVPERAEFTNGLERGRLSSRPAPSDPSNPQAGVDWALQRPDADHSRIPVVFE